MRFRRCRDCGGNANEEDALILRLLEEQEVVQSCCGFAVRLGMNVHGAASHFSWCSR